MERLLTLGEVAALFNRSVYWFYENRRKLERRGFPQPIARGAYDPEAIAAWRRAQMSPALRAVLGGEAGERAVADAVTDRLNANAKRLAAEWGRKRNRK